MNAHLKQLELYFKSTNFDRALRLGVAILVPFAMLYFLGYFEYAAAIVVGAFLNAPGDIPGSVTRKVKAILISIGLTMVITSIILFVKPYLPVLIVAIAFISFAVSFISIYGFRASLVSFSGLLAMVLGFAVVKETPREILLHVLLMGIGGLWYLLVSFIFQRLAPKKDDNQLLSDTLLLIGQYLKLRAKLLTKKTMRDDILKQTFVLQNQINEKHETLREALLLERKRSGRSHSEEKQLLIFLSTINIFELIEAKHLDYKTIDQIFGNRKEFLKPAKKLNNTMGNHLIRLSELLIQKDKIPNKGNLLKALSNAQDAIAAYVEEVKLPEAREGALVLQNLYDYQEQLLQEIRAIRRVMANVKGASVVPVKRQDSKLFLTLQEYSFDVIVQNFSMNCSMFRHSLRFTVAMVFAYLLGTFLDIQNTYWILLTIIVIMRPSFGLTKERSKDRIIGTLIGAVVAIGIVLITHNLIVYGILGFVSLILAFSLIQQNYKWAAALITISIVFVYSLMNPNAFEVIQYRVLDTVIGASIAVVANYVIFPSWEADNLKSVLINILEKNQAYLLATQALYHDKTEHKLTYNIARKDTFLGISNLNAAFQRLTQDPKSKQKEYQLIYEMVTLNQTIVSAIASIGSFIINHNTTPVSKESDLLFSTVSNTLEACYSILEHSKFNSVEEDISIKAAEETLLKHYQKLSKQRDENIEKGEGKLKQDALHQLQEAYLIANHLSWLKTLSQNLKKVTLKYDQSISKEVS
ncbi:MAG: FUSC family membrane protein [Aquaticitalea sp.]